MLSVVQSLFGMSCLLGLAYLFSSDRRAISWRLVGFGVLLQVILCLLVSHVPLVRELFRDVSHGFVTLVSFARDGAKFVFGNDLPSPDGKLGFVFAFNVLQIENRKRVVVAGREVQCVGRKFQQRMARGVEREIAR